MGEMSDAAAVAEAIGALIETRSGGIDPVHAADDAGKLAALVESMSADGWNGPPLVVDGEQALTGAHRYEAARVTYTDIPRIQVTELCEIYGADWEGLRADHGDWYEAARRLDEVLPAAVVEYLGLDLH
jgi:hypothetical protein